MNWYKTAQAFGDLLEDDETDIVEDVVFEISSAGNEAEEILKVIATEAEHWSNGIVSKDEAMADPVVHELSEMIRDRVLSGDWEPSMNMYRKIAGLLIMSKVSEMPIEQLISSIRINAFSGLCNAAARGLMSNKEEFDKKLALYNRVYGSDPSMPPPNRNSSLGYLLSPGG
jgi:hypothetical protein